VHQDDGYFDERIAAKYDEADDEEFDPEVIDQTVGFLADLAGVGRALEFGIGTGRIALRSRGAVCRCTGSTCRSRWSRS
jgi:hypothetical protein